MPELSKLTVENVQLFLMMVVPGFVTLKVYELFVPAGERSASAALLEAITYGMVNLALMSWAVLFMLQYDMRVRHPIWYVVASSGILVVTPALLGWGMFRLRVSRFASRWLQHPMPSAWDYFFSSRRPCWVIFHLKNGKKVGGIYGPGSYATSYPNEAEAYVEQAWRVDNFGRFSSKVDRSLGIIIRQGECEAIEFFDPKGG
jgi:hypothetical protein